MQKKVALFFSLSLVFVHTVLWAYILYLNIEGSNSDAPMGWLILLILDFPISMGLTLEVFHRDGNYEWNNITLPALYFGILGTIWWYSIPQLISYGINRLRMA